MSEPRYRCIRCGGDVHERGSACGDCRLTDRKLCESWRASAAEELARQRLAAQLRA